MENVDSGNYVCSDLDCYDTIDTVRAGEVIRSGQQKQNGIFNMMN